MVFSLPGVLPGSKPPGMRNHRLYAQPRILRGVLTYMKKSTLTKIVKFLLHHLTRTEYVGLENVPQEGAMIIALNHLSQMDTPLMLAQPARSDLTALVTDKYKNFAFLRWFVETVEGIWIDRDRADFGAFRAGLDVLKTGRPLGIAPEGTRSKTAQLLPGKPGVNLLAMKSGAPIMPVAITGTEHAFRMIFTFRKPHMVARFGKPFHLPPLNRENRDEELQRMTDEIMCRIAVMLPPEYRGAYEHHPRLLELLEDPEVVLQKDASRVRL